MKKVLALTDYDQMVLTLHPLRREILRFTREPTTVQATATHLETQSQRIAYHVRKLLDAELLEVVDRRKSGSSIERVLQATAESYILSDDFDPPPDIQAQLVQKIYDIAKERATSAFLTGNANLQVFDEEAPSKFFIGEWQLSPDDYEELIQDLDRLSEKYTGKMSSDKDTVRSSVLLTAHIH